MADEGGRVPGDLQWTEKITQAWARAIRAAYQDLDGVWYRSSMDGGEPAVCLWDPPAGGALPEKPDVLLPLDHPGLTSRCHGCARN